MLLTRRGFNRGDHLSYDAHFREGMERRLLVGLVIADCLVKADHALLDDILPVRSYEEVGARLALDKSPVAFVEDFLRDEVRLLCEHDQIFIG
ncbi:hypothetical protein SDC9_191982 [bioreactor metagenome]|uniref:Uncharacterized protein n=1 Tax=bioreactor metagenome TaxID=1076179 RepID=A0A645HZG6_9ZZZZ